MIDLDKLPQFKKELDAVGCGFCLAKWTQVTMHLGSGLTHSCHHVGAHKIPLDELAINPSALHNTNFKKEIRKEMLAGKRPAECDYCWRIEDNTNNFSDRITKSSDKWSVVDKDKIIASTGDENIFPRYVEVSFSNVCNFKCSYCGPAFSSKWSEEIKSKGPYILKNKLLKSHQYNGIKETEVPILEREDNPYIEAFWKWFPEAVKHMLVFRITGGEPLLSKHTNRVIQYLINNPQPNLEFSINTNACPPATLWKKFVNSIKVLENNNSVKEFILYTSAESYGEQSEYSRDGMDWSMFTRNVEYLLTNTTNVTVSFMSAFNILSLPMLTNYIRYVKMLKRRFENRIILDFAYVRHPRFLDINIATDELLIKYFKIAVDSMKSSPEFTPWENNTLDRIYNDCASRFGKPATKDILLNRFRFVQFVNEYDRRRNKNFLKVFPEYKEFYKLCENSNV
jgi:hypothetical protein